MSEELENIEETNDLTAITESAEDSLRPWDMEKNTFMLLMHLSPLASNVFPFAGLVLLIVMWNQYKDKSKEIDRHGKMLLNWSISLFIYIVVSIVLMFVVVGIFLLIAVAIVSLIFMIKGAIAANKGEFYEYPMTIKFIK